MSDETTQCPEAVLIADRAKAAAYALANGPIAPMHPVWASHAHHAASEAIACLQQFQARMSKTLLLREMTDEVQ